MKMQISNYTQLFTFCYIYTFLVFFPSFLTAQSYPSGKSILSKVDFNMSAKSRIMTARMEINTARGTRTIESKSWTEGTDNSFTEYLAPAREKGTKMLKLGKQLWIYSPTTDRVIQMSGHMLRQPVMGSDLSYEDMMSDRPLLEQYEAEVMNEELEDGRKCWMLNLKAIVKDVNYNSEKIWVDEDRFVPLKIELFAKGGKLLKRINFSEIKKIKNLWYPTSILYKDVLKDGKGTKMLILDIQNDVSISANIFSKGNLK